jgi:hypothetical protein
MDNPYDAPASTVAATVADNRFKHPGTLTRLVRLCVAASAVTAAITFFTTLSQRALLRHAEADGLSVDEAYAEMPLHLLLAPLPQLLALLSCYVIIAFWIHRMAANTRSLAGAGKMEYTPGWAVGWFFLPIANLWKPYQAMKEVWALNTDDGRGAGGMTGLLLPLWWFLWLAWNIVSNAAGRMSWRATSFEQEDNAALASMTSDAINVPLCIVFLLVVNRLYAAQMRGYASRQSESLPPDPMQQGPAAPELSAALPSSIAQEPAP